MSVKIITDSTCDLPKELVKELGITVVPLNVHFGEQVYSDGVDIQADEFYDRLLSNDQYPTTSQPSPGAFIEQYKPHLDAGDQIASIHISSSLSGTCDSAILAKNEIGEGKPIEVIDTMHASLAAGLIVAAAARVAKNGGSLSDVIGESNNARREVKLFFTLDTLEYLEKGGRIGKAQSLMGSLLQIKPILTMRDGQVHPLTRIRSRRKAIMVLDNLVREAMPIKEMFLGYSTDEAEADAMYERLSGIVDKAMIVRGRFGPVIGTYAGPRALGVAVRRAV